MTTIIKSDQVIGNFPPKASFNQDIFKPTNTKTNPSPYFKYLNFLTTPASIKYIARKPSIANTFDVKTISGSFVIAKIAGTESTANIISDTSMKSNAINKGVAYKTPSFFMKNFCPSILGVTLNNFLKSFITGLFSGLMGFSGAKIILKPVSIKNTPNIITINWY